MRSQIATSMVTKLVLLRRTRKGSWYWDDGRRPYGTCSSHARYPALKRWASGATPPGADAHKRVLQRHRRKIFYVNASRLRISLLRLGAMVRRSQTGREDGHVIQKGQRSLPSQSRIEMAVRRVLGSVRDCVGGSSVRLPQESAVPKGAISGCPSGTTLRETHRNGGR